MPVETFEKQKPPGESPDDFIITVTDWDEGSKRMVSFCVIQIYCFEENTFEIIKFDSAHGNCHVHRYYRRLDDEGEAIDREVSPDAFNEFRADIKENWRKYKRWYMEKRLSGQ